MTLGASDRYWSRDKCSLYLGCEEIIEVTMHSYHKEPEKPCGSQLAVCKLSLYVGMVYFHVFVDFVPNNILLQLQIMVTSSSKVIIFLFNLECGVSWSVSYQLA